MRTNINILFLVLVLCFTSAHSRSVEDHNARREALLKKEYDQMYGEHLELSSIEIVANEIVMKEKHLEYDAGFMDVSQFNPSEHFFSRKPFIQKSKIFQIIKEMPKGAALHVHDTALLGEDYLLNITYRPNLYMCFVNEKLSLRFSNGPPTNTDCQQWQLMEDVRKKHENVEEFDASLKKLFTMEVDDGSYVDYNNYGAWEKISEIFALITPMLTYRPVWHDYFYDALAEFRKDKIMYVEIRTTLPILYDLDGNEYDEIECAKSLKSSHLRFVADHPDSYGMRIIYAPLRRVPNEQVQKYIEITKSIKNLLGDFVAGFDLVGQEDLGRPLIEFIEELVAIPEDIDLFYHAGETNWYGTTTDYNMIDAVLLGAKRLGHAYGIIKHPAVCEVVKKNNIAIEVNPISNQVLGYIKDLRNHPAIPLFAENYSMIISSDDPGLWGSLPLSHDIYEAFMGLASRRSDIRFLKQLALNSIEVSAMSTDEKNSVRRDFLDRWNDFIDKIIDTEEFSSNID